MKVFVRRCNQARGVAKRVKGSVRRVSLVKREMGQTAELGEELSQDQVLQMDNFLWMEEERQHHVSQAILQQGLVPKILPALQLLKINLLASVHDRLSASLIYPFWLTTTLIKARFSGSF